MINDYLRRMSRPDWRSGDASTTLRPWWGMNPVRLVARAVIQGVISMVLLVVLLRVRSGEYIPDDASLADSRESIRTGALVLAVLAGLWFAASVVRLVIGVLDLVGRRSVEGSVVSVVERRSWGFLPPIVQHLVFRRRDTGMDERRCYLVLTIHTDGGPRSWSTRPGKVGDLQPGRRVRVVATPINGYVRSVDVIDSPR